MIGKRGKKANKATGTVVKIEADRLGRSFINVPVELAAYARSPKLIVKVVGHTAILLRKPVRSRELMKLNIERWKASRHLRNVRSQIIAELTAFFNGRDDVDFAAVFDYVAKIGVGLGSQVDVVVVGNVSWLKLNAQLRALARSIGYLVHLKVFGPGDEMTPWEGSDGSMHDLQSSPFIPVKDTFCTHARRQLNEQRE